MEHLSFNGLLVVTLIAVSAPILVAALRLKIPAPVIEIVAGILVGPSVQWGSPRTRRGWCGARCYWPSR